jgi:hypothetical protein
MPMKPFIPESGIGYAECRLDVTFREDGSRLRDPTAGRNVSQNRSITGSTRGKRKRAAWDDDYMLQLKIHFMR